MKEVLAFVAIAVSLLNSGPRRNCHVGPETTAVADTGQLASLTVTVPANEIRYCQGDNEVYTAHLRLALHYTNIGSENLILFKPVQPIEIDNGVIAQDLEKLKGKEYEAALGYDVFREPLVNLDFASEPDMRRFVIVRPGESFDILGALAIPVRAKQIPEIPGTIPTGSHFMTIEVVNWPFSDDIGRQLRVRWVKTGILLYEQLKTTPFRFTIPSNPHLADCSEGNADSGRAE